MLFCMTFTFGKFYHFSVFLYTVNFFNISWIAFKKLYFLFSDYGVQYINSPNLYYCIMDSIIIPSAFLLS